MQENGCSQFYESFVSYICRKCKESNQFSAALRKADLEVGASQAWPILVRFVDITKSYEYLPFAVVAASIAREKEYVNGSLSLGVAIALAYSDRPTKLEDLEKSPATARLRRLLACTDTDELVMCLRPVLSLIQSRVTSGNLNYAFLLRDLVKFYYDPDRIKKSWANSFYKVVYKPKE